VIGILRSERGDRGWRRSAGTAAPYLVGAGCLLVVVTGALAVDAFWLPLPGLSRVTVGLTAAVVVEAAILAGGLVIEVDLPGGGTVALGHALAIAFAVILRPAQFGIVTAAALALSVPVRLSRPDGAIPTPHPVRPSWRTWPNRWLTVLGVARLAAAAAAATAVHSLFRAGPLRSGSGNAFGVLIETLAAGAAYLAIELPTGGAAAWRVRGLDLKQRLAQLGRVAAPRVYAALLCSAALLAIAYEQRGATAALVAGVPLLVTKVSFSRFAEARSIYAQTVRALGILPEVSGLTPLGHSERTAWYAAALTDAYGFDDARAEEVVTAARLHHIGRAFDDAEPDRGDAALDPWQPAVEPELGRAGAGVLRETGFLAGVADLVQAGASPSGGGLDAAIVRVASSFDDLIERHDGALDAVSIGLLCTYVDGPERSLTLTLLQACDADPGLVADARDRGEKGLAPSRAAVR
jgi:hypothetical protein